jgi:hypothetical protein
MSPLFHNFLGDLWDEVIEFSTLGPGERKFLKQQRRQQQDEEQQQQQRLQQVELQEKQQGEEKFVSFHDDVDLEQAISLEAFQKAKEKRASSRLSKYRTVGVASYDDRNNTGAIVTRRTAVNKND